MYVYFHFYDLLIVNKAVKKLSLTLEKISQLSKRVLEKKRGSLSEKYAWLITSDRCV